MREIQIGAVIAKKRKEKGLTQDQLAAYMGVSKTAVSKWETDQSFPDVTFLPILASYFNISIDTLIGYEPQMSNEDISRYYHQMCTAFVQEPLDDVLTQLDQQVKKYHSCYTLLLYIALLYINHLNLMQGEQTEEVVAKAKALCCSVRENSTKLQEQRIALECEAMCNLLLNKPLHAISLLERIEPIRSNYLLAQSYQMNQQPEQAIEVLQADMLQALKIMLDSAQMLVMLYMGDKEKLEVLLSRMEQLDVLFNLTKFEIGGTLPLLINTFTVYATLQDREHTYAALHRYINVLDQCKGFQTQQDDFFDHINSKTFELEIPIELPRSEEVIKKSCLQCIVENPALAWLYEEEEFKQLVKRLEGILNRTNEVPTKNKGELL